MSAQLSHSQLPLWVGQRLSPASPLYNMAFVLEIEGDVDPERFREAWQSVVDGSSLLRTSFETDDTGRPERRLRGAGCCPVEILDWRNRTVADGAVLDWAREIVERPMALEGELTRSLLVRLTETRTVWLLSQHHLITDATSSVLLFRETARAYARLAKEDPTRHPASDEALVDYDDAMASILTPPPPKVLEAAQDHWRERATARRVGALYGHVTFLGDERTTTASRRLTLELDTETTRRIADLANTPGLRSFSPDMSRFAVYAALLAAWLNRLSGSRELGFDAPVAGRPTPGSKRALGPFIELFPFHLDVEPGDTFRSLGERALAETQLLLRHGLPGLGPRGGESTSNVVLNFVPVSFDDFAGLPTQVTWIHPGHGDALHSLRLQVHDFGATGSTTLHFDFNLEALPECEQERALQHFRLLLNACLEDPDRPLGRLNLLTADDRHRLEALDGDLSAPRATETVVDAFLRQARERPDSPALRAGGDVLSFAELERKTAALASGLAPFLTTRAPTVAILAGRSPDVIVAILGSLRAGAAYVPIDPSSPPVRRAQLIGDSGAAVLLTAGSVRGGTSASGAVPVRSVEDLLDEVVEGGPSHDLVERALPELDDLAYMIYTSGSTGRPKGVLVDHAGLADYLSWAAATYVRGETFDYALCTSLAVDLTVTTLFLPFVVGGTLEIYPESDDDRADDQSNPNASSHSDRGADETLDSGFLAALSAGRCDFIKLTPAHLRVAGRLDLDSTRLRCLIVGGEDFSSRLAENTSRKLSGSGSHERPHPLEIYNEYGPTEAVVGCSVHRYDPASTSGTSVPIGRPARGVALHVLNDEGATVPPGVPGELWIASPRLARGYHDRPELTAQAFQELPGHGDEGTRPRSYRTGDLVRIDSGDRLEFLGRIDRQLKISGHRAEPGEIEAALLGHPAVAECVVGVRPDRSTGSTTTSIEASGAKIHHCTRCGLPSNYPRASFDEEGVCSVCRAYDGIEETASAYFRSMADLQAIFDQSRSRRSPSSRYDCMMLLSGGKDSTYALCQLVEMGLSVLAFSLDNGFISDGAKSNMRRVTDRLGIDLELATTPAMNAIFRDSLERYSNVCHGCFKTIYTLSTRRARELDIPIIVTGLSRGQMFETRLTEELFRGERFDSDEVDRAVLAARKVYHRVDDAVSRSLDVTIFQDDAVFDEVQYVDFYRYCNAGLSEVLGYLEEKMPWVRPEDTGRSTNCLINDTGIWVHKHERGFHNYALPYSWDVRMGHKTRSEALGELDDDIDIEQVRLTLQEVGYEPKSRGHQPQSQPLVAFYVSCLEGSEDIPADELRKLAAETLPAQLVPSRFIRLDELPLRSSGKLDESALPWDAGSSTSDDYVEPSGPVEAFLAEVWELELGLQGSRLVGAESDFFALGGTSLGAMEVMIRLCQEFDIDLALESPFKHRTLRELARLAEDTILSDVASLSAEEQQELLESSTE